VITAIVTSQFAGWWLGRALRRRGELLGERIGDAAPTPRVGATGPEPELVATVDVTAPQDTSVGTAATSGGRT
jgi:hypothetical protein